MSLKIEKVEDGKTHKFILNGDVDSANVGGLRKLLMAVLETDPKSIVLDFDAVEFLDSTGIGTIIQAYKQVSKIGGEFKLTGMSGQPLQTFTFLKLDHLIDVA